MAISVATSVYRPSGGDRPELLDPVATHTDIPVVEVDGRVAMAGDQSDPSPSPNAVVAADTAGCRGRRGLIGQTSSALTTTRDEFGGCRLTIGTSDVYARYGLVSRRHRELHRRELCLPEGTDGSPRRDPSLR